MTHLFLHLPEIILEQSDWGNFLKDLRFLLDSAKKDKLLTIHYDGENLRELVKAIQENREELSIGNVRGVLEQRLRAAEDWRDQKQHQGVYYYWIPEEGRVEQVPALSFAEAAHRAESGDKVVLINLNPEHEFPSPLSLFRAENTPTFTSVKLLNGVVKYKTWYDELQGSRPFTLENNPDFQLTELKVQGKKVYQEKKTGRFWYLDNLHRDHFEVFDKTGKIHLGEANMQGEIDESKADSDKKLST
ncbi:MAG: hypothetical protein AAF740_12165 [Bacteroidota bacterium]